MPVGGQQLSSWEFVRRRNAAVRAHVSKVGPFVACQGESAYRNHDCGNYDACLSHAVQHGWPNFTCNACRKQERPDVDTVSV